MGRSQDGELVNGGRWDRATESGGIPSSTSSMVCANHVKTHANAKKGCTWELTRNWCTSGSIFDNSGKSWANIRVTWSWRTSHFWGVKQHHNQIKWYEGIVKVVANVKQWNPLEHCTRITFTTDLQTRINTNEITSTALATELNEKTRTMFGKHKIGLERRQNRCISKKWHSSVNSRKVNG